MNKVVARFTDGRVVKGFTNDFAPDRALFHVNVDGAPPASKAEELSTSDLKALYEKLPECPTACGGDEWQTINKVAGF